MNLCVCLLTYFIVNELTLVVVVVDLGVFVVCGGEGLGSGVVVVVFVIRVVDEAAVVLDTSGGRLLVTLVCVWFDFEGTKLGVTVGF